MDFVNNYLLYHKEVGFVYFLLALIYAFLVKKYAQKNAGYYAKLGGALIVLVAMVQTYSVLYSYSPEDGSALLYPTVMHGLAMAVFVAVALFFGLKLNVRDTSAKGAVKSTVRAKVAPSKVAVKSHKKRK
jgi:hypothetical protein